MNEKTIVTAPTEGPRVMCEGIKGRQEHEWGLLVSFLRDMVCTLVFLCVCERQTDSTQRYFLSLSCLFICPKLSSLKMSSACVHLWRVRDDH